MCATNEGVRTKTGQIEVPPAGGAVWFGERFTARSDGVVAETAHGARVGPAGKTREQGGARLVQSPTQCQSFGWALIGVPRAHT